MHLLTGEDHQGTQWVQDIPQTTVLEGKSFEQSNSPSLMRVM